MYWIYQLYVNGQSVADYTNLFSPNNFKRNEKYLCNGCQDLTQKAMSFNDVAIVSIIGNVYRIHFWYMSKNDAIALITNSSLKYE